MHYLYFIRHAESVANQHRLLGSRVDYPLTEAGLKDALRIAEELKEITHLDGIVTSPVLRARQTTDAFSEVFNIVPIVDDNLAEQELGPFSCKSYDEVKNMDGYENDTLARWDWNPGGGGESYSMVADRVIEFFKSVESFPLESTWLIVTHAVVFRLIRAALENTLPVYSEKFPNNGEIWRVACQGLGVRHDIRAIFLGESRKFIHLP